MGQNIKHLVEMLAERNRALFVFGACNLLAAAIFMVLTQFSSVTVRGVNAWYKPLKFALSIGVFSLTMGWLTHDLPASTVQVYSWGVIVLLGFEVVYIGLQAGRGRLSHYNNSTLVFSFSML